MDAARRHLARNPKQAEQAGFIVNELRTGCEPCPLGSFSASPGAAAPGRSKELQFAGNTGGLGFTVQGLGFFSC